MKTEIQRLIIIPRGNWPPEAETVLSSCVWQANTVEPLYLMKVLSHNKPPVFPGQSGM